MKNTKRYFLTSIIMLLAFVSQACDICGCGSGGNYIGILPEFSKHVAGLRYRNNAMATHLGVGGAITYLTTQEQYNTLEIWGGWTIKDKVRLMLTLPYGFNQKTNQSITKRKSGIGDVSVSAFYQLLNNRKTVFSNKLLVQSLWLGGGVKLPIGKYSPTDENSSGNDANLFQLGTGSFDFNITAMYDIRLQDAGVNLMGNYKLTTVNKYDYKYGNKFNISGQTYYKFRIAKKSSIAPSLGIQYETSQTDLNNEFDVFVSGGNLLLFSAGMETVYKLVAIGANYQLPLSQNLARGIVKANDRWMLHVSYLF